MEPSRVRQSPTGLVPATERRDRRGEKEPAAAWDTLEPGVAVGYRRGTGRARVAPGPSLKTLVVLPRKRARSLDEVVQKANLGGP
jgi:hypothetical protein